MSLNKSELIAKLEKISFLHHKALSIKHKMANFVPEDNYERKVIVPAFPGEYKDEEDREILECAIKHEDEDAIEQMAETYDEMYHPKMPSEPVKPVYNGADTGKSKEKQRKLRLVSNIGLGVAIFFLLGALVGTSDTPEALPAILIIAALGAAAFVGGRFLEKKEKEEVEDKLEAEARAEYEKKLTILNEQYKKAVSVYEDECETYVPVRQDFLKKYADWRKIYLDSLAEEKKISELLAADRQAAVAKIENEEFTPALTELAEVNDILTTDYLPAVDIIIDLLKTGRADNVKEAINLYEEMLYRERQLKLQREQEEQRRREEEMRRQDEERRHREEMEFQREQEYNRQREEEKRRQDEERRYREERTLQEKQERNRQYEDNRRRQEERRREEKAELERKRQQDSATRRQCNTCALASHCSVAFTRPNCASYKPR